MGSGQNAIGARQSEMRPTRGTRNGGGLLQPRPRRTDRNDQTGKRPVHQAPLSQTQSQESSVCEIEAIVDSAPVAPTTPVPRVKRRTPTKTKPTMTFLAPSISPTDSKTDGSFVENSFVVKLMQENHELLKSKYQEITMIQEENSDLKSYISDLERKIDTLQKVVDQFQSDGAVPGVDKPKAVIASDEVSAYEAAQASKEVAQKLIIGLTEKDMKSDGAYLPRIHFSPLLDCRSNTDAKGVHEMICAHVSKKRVESCRPPVVDIPMSYTTSKKTKGDGSEETKKMVDTTLFTIFLTKRREAKNDCSQKTIVQEVRRNPAIFKEGSETFPDEKSRDTTGCGFFQKGWADLFDKVFSDDESAATRLVSSTRLAMLRCGVRRARSSIAKERTRQSRAEGSDGQVASESANIGRSIFEIWDREKKPNDGHFLCRAKCCWLMDIAPLPAGLCPYMEDDDEVGNEIASDEQNSDPTENRTLSGRKRKTVGLDDGEDDYTDEGTDEPFTTKRKAVGDASDGGPGGGEAPEDD